MAESLSESHFSQIGGLEADIWAIVAEKAQEHALDASGVSELRKIVREWLFDRPTDAFRGAETIRDGEMVGLHLEVRPEFVNSIAEVAARLAA